MVKFQSNFTTSEQSKKLLELGVPADSADCYYKSWNTDNLPRLLFFPDTYSDMLEEYSKEYHNIFMPCWSVGRLFEIIAICLPAEIVISTDEYPYVLDNILQVIEDCIEEFDFSKLEEQ